MFKKVIKEFVPPVLFRAMKYARSRLTVGVSNPSDTEQDLSVYWDSEMAKILETWGEKNVWKEIQLLMVNKDGKVLDIACGTGKTMEILSSFPLELHGCDISDMLVEKAIQRGLPHERLMVCDATNMPYEDDFFDYSYSIGSLEHFSEAGIDLFLREVYRVSSKVSYHQIPVSKSGENQGWIKTYQSYHNNSVDWWLEKFNKVYGQVYAIDSTWEDSISNGKWFVCAK